MKYHFKIHGKSGEFWGECVELPNCHTQGCRKKDLLENLEATLNLYLGTGANAKKGFPKPGSGVKGKNIMEVPVVPRIAWAISLKTARLARGFTQETVAKLLNIKNISVYQKLESAATANPCFDTIVRVKKVFPELDLEAVVTDS